MISANSELVLNYLKSHYGQEFTKAELAETLGISVPAVTGSMNGLIKKGYAVTTHEETVVDAEATETRKAKTHVVKYHTLTEAGLSYDPVAEDAARQAEKAAEKERKAAERAAAKAAKEAAE